MRRKKSAADSDPVVTFRLPRELKDELQRIAKEDEHTIAQLVRRIVKEYLRSKGLLEGAPSEIGNQKLEKGQGKLLMREGPIVKQEK